MSPVDPSRNPATADLVPAQILPGGDSGITFTRQQRDIQVFDVMDTELTMIKQSSPSNPISFLTLCIGLAVGFGSTLLTVPLSDRAYAVYCALLLVSVVLAAFFGVATRKALAATDQLVETIRQRPRA